MVSYESDNAGVLCPFVQAVNRLYGFFIKNTKKGASVMVKIAPSILSADFANLERDIAKVQSADYLHVDVMDGLFVPNITIGVPVVRCVRRVTSLPLDVHLMIDRPARFVNAFCDAGADIVTVHLESCGSKELVRTLDAIRTAGKRPGLALKPATPAEAALPFLSYCSLVLVMTVEPGFGGQSFMFDMMPKLLSLRNWINQHSLPCELEVDGGINPDTAKIAVDNGADVLVAGSAVYHAPDIPKRILELRG